MSGQWATDPYGRAELRYWDSTVWTEHVSDQGVVRIDHPQQQPRQQALPTTRIAPVPAGYTPYGAVPQKAGTSGRLIAAGVMTIIEASLTLILGLWLFSVTQSEVGGLFDDITGGTLTFVTILIVGFGVAVLTAGIGACKGRNWGRIMVIVFHAIGAAILLLGALSADDTTSSSSFSNETESSPVGGIVMILAWNAVILFLAITGKPKVVEVPTYAVAPAASQGGGFGPPSVG